ncbi:MAG: hypothetical protein AAFX92_02770 [Pseudomonadota bacterium]
MEALLYGLLRSLGDTGVSERAHVAVLDFGLSDSARVGLAELCDEVIDPRPIAASTIAFSDPQDATVLCRVLLPAMVPGHDIYLWIDADVWVQDAQMLDVFASFTTAKDVVVVAETDPAYGGIQRRHDWIVSRADAMYGAETAHQLSIRPCLNAGVIAARASSPLWRVWLDHLRALGNRQRRLLCDQTSLNYLVFCRQISAYLLPPVYNWVCHAATPKWLMEEGYWARPLFPHAKIAVMHLTSSSRPFSADFTDGHETFTVDLSYDSAVKLREWSAGRNAGQLSRSSTFPDMLAIP